VPVNNLWHSFVVGPVRVVVGGDTTLFRRILSVTISPYLGVCCFHVLAHL
jgi:hypothetical protein